MEKVDRQEQSGHAGSDGAGHVPVLAAKVLELLEPGPGQTILDATLGAGGHAAMILPQLASDANTVHESTYIGLDLDPANISRARERLEPLAERHQVRLITRQANFRHAREVLDELAIGRVHGLLADLGVASTQLDDPARGLSFAQPGPLDMRLGPGRGVTAAELVNTLDQRELADLIFHQGEEPLARRIARKIVEARAESPIQTTDKLAALVRQAYGPRARRSRMHPATRTFMALRIAVNDELGALDALLAALPGLIAGNGRAVVVSFHSLEDRRVKRAINEMHRQGLGKRLTRKVVTAGEAEKQSNPRARSAKLRGFEFHGPQDVAPADTGTNPP